MSGVQPPPGWYPDNQNPFRVRYWDGHAWTEHTRLASEPPVPAATTVARPAGRGFGRGLIAGGLVGAGAIGAVVLLVVAALAMGTQASVSSGEAGPLTRVEQRGTKPSPERSHAKHERRNPADKKADTHQRHQRVPKPAPRPKPAPAPQPRTFLVTRVVDGDTLELGNGETVRLVGIDTPEVGQCGYDRAAAALARLVSGRQVELGRSDEDRDHYGRLLRYVDIGNLDAGLRLVRSGLAIARYDSRDGYGFHPREPRYVAADRATADVHCSRPAPAPAPQPLVGGGACAPGYSPCVPPYPPDADCADVDGPIMVTGSDPHGLDADGDGVACE